MEPLLASAGVGAALILALLWRRHHASPNRHVRYTPPPSLGDLDAHPAEVAPAVKALRAGFEGSTVTCTLPPRDFEYRAQQIWGCIDFVEENKEALFQAHVKDLGKSRADFDLETAAFLADLKFILNGFPAWARTQTKATPLFLAPSSSYVTPQPRGVVLVLGSYNYPMPLCLQPVVAALAAGNSVLLKPSEKAPNVARVMELLLPKYVDPACLRVVLGGANLVKRIVNEEDIDFAFYTGGPVAGKAIGAACAARFIPFVLEMGGTSPVIVAPDADLGVTARRVIQGKMINAGQTCIAGNHVIVVGDAAREKAMIEELVVAIKQQYWGSGDVLVNPSFGRIVTKVGHESLCRILDKVRDNTNNDNEVELAWGGRSQDTVDPDKFFVEPTVLRVKKPTPAPDVVTKEIFGPILPVLRVSSMEEAIAYVRNWNDNALAVYVFSNNATWIDQVVRRTSSGGVCVNDCCFQAANPYLPFGGIKGSGVGMYHGQAGFECMSHMKSVLHQSMRVDLPVRYLPWLAHPWAATIAGWVM